MIRLVQEKTFSPRPIKRELRSILHLFEQKNFAEAFSENKIANQSTDVTRLLEWMTPMMANYCAVFEIKNCNRTGCGIDDNCKSDEVCKQPEEHVKTGYECVANGK